MTMSNSETMPLTMPVMMAPIPFTIAISTLPMVRQMDSNWIGWLAMAWLRGTEVCGTYAGDDSTHGYSL